MEKKRVEIFSKWFSDVPINGHCWVHGRSWFSFVKRCILTWKNHNNTVWNHAVHYVWIRSYFFYKYSTWPCRAILWEKWFTPAACAITGPTQCLTATALACPDVTKSRCQSNFISLSFNVLYILRGYVEWCITFLYKCIHFCVHFWETNNSVVLSVLINKDYQSNLFTCVD